MHIRTLKVFCDVIQLSSFSKAAAENGMTQSGASQLVRQLEQYLDVTLVDRSTRPLTLTPEGEVFYKGCLGIVERYYALEDKVRSLHREVSGRVRVASIYSVGLHQMNHCLQTFMAKYPCANVRLEYLHPQRVYESVENDTADLGIVSYPKASRSITALAWRTEPMVLVVSPRHPLAKRQSVAIEELKGEAMIGFDQDLTIRREVDRVLAAHGVDPHVVMEFDNIETIKRAIEINAGVALLPEPTVLREVAGGSLAMIPLATQEMVRPLGIIYRRGKELSETAWQFVELLKRENVESDEKSCALDRAGLLDTACSHDGAGPRDANDIAETVLDNTLASGHASQADSYAASAE